MFSRTPSAPVFALGLSAIVAFGLLPTRSARAQEAPTATETAQTPSPAAEVDAADTAPSDEDAEPGNENNDENNEEVSATPSGDGEQAGAPDSETTPDDQPGADAADASASPVDPAGAPDDSTSVSDAPATAPTEPPPPPAGCTPEVCAKMLEDQAKADAAAAAEAEKLRKQGFWVDKKLTLGATGLGVFNRAFVGQPDGFSATLGAFLNGSVTLGYGGHLLENTLTVNEAIVLSPGGEDLLKNPIPLVQKAADEAVATSEYRFMWQKFPYVGPYVRARIQTRLLPTFVMTGGQRALVFTDRDGAQRREVAEPYVPYIFSSFFEPTTFSEGAGIHIEPPTLPPWVKYTFKTGVLATHVLAGNGYIRQDNPDTPELELNQLSIVNSAGASAEANVSGEVFENVVWGLGLAVYYPILAIGGASADLSLLERTHVDGKATLSLRVNKWLSLDSQARVLREPFVLNDWQFQASALVTAGFNIL